MHCHVHSCWRIKLASWEGKVTHFWWFEMGYHYFFPITWKVKSKSHTIQNFICQDERGYNLQVFHCNRNSIQTPLSSLIQQWSHFAFFCLLRTLHFSLKEDNIWMTKFAESGLVPECCTLRHSSGCASPCLYQLWVPFGGSLKQTSPAIILNCLSFQFPKLSRGVHKFITDYFRRHSA